jgi:hypothetical protein
MRIIVRGRGRRAPLGGCSIHRKSFRANSRGSNIRSSVISRIVKASLIEINPRRYWIKQRAFQAINRIGTGMIHSPFIFASSAVKEKASSGTRATNLRPPNASSAHQREAELLIYNSPTSIHPTTSAIARFFFHKGTSPRMASKKMGCHDKSPWRVEKRVGSIWGVVQPKKLFPCGMVKNVSYIVFHIKTWGEKTRMIVVPNANR